MLQLTETGSTGKPRVRHRLPVGCCPRALEPSDWSDRRLGLHQFLVGYEVHHDAEADEHGEHRGAAVADQG